MIIRKVTITLAQTPHLKDEEVEVREGGGMGRKEEGINMYKLADIKIVMGMYRT